MAGATGIYGGSEEGEEVIIGYVVVQVENFITSIGQSAGHAYTC